MKRKGAPTSGVRLDPFRSYLQSTSFASRFSWPGLYSIVHSIPTFRLPRLDFSPPILTVVRLLDIDEDTWPFFPWNLIFLPFFPTSSKCSGHLLDRCLGKFLDDLVRRRQDIPIQLC